MTVCLGGAEEDLPCVWLERKVRMVSPVMAEAAGPFLMRHSKRNSLARLSAGQSAVGVEAKWCDGVPEVRW